MKLFATLAFGVVMVVLATAAALSSSCTRGEGYDLAGGDSSDRKYSYRCKSCLVGKSSAIRSSIVALLVENTIFVPALATADLVPVRMKNGYSVCEHEHLFFLWTGMVFCRDVMETNMNSNDDEKFVKQYIYNKLNQVMQLAEHNRKS